MICVASQVSLGGVVPIWWWPSYWVCFTF